MHQTAWDWHLHEWLVPTLTQREEQLRWLRQLLEDDIWISQS